MQLDTLGLGRLAAAVGVRFANRLTLGISFAGRLTRRLNRCHGVRFTYRLARCRWCLLSRQASPQVTERGW